MRLFCTISKFSDRAKTQLRAYDSDPVPSPPTTQEVSMFTHSLMSAFSSPTCSLSPSVTYFGPHQERAPATNATHVKPHVPSTKLGLKRGGGGVSALIVWGQKSLQGIQYYIGTTVKSVILMVHPYQKF